VETLDAEKGPSLGNEELGGFEIDRERVATLGYKGVADQLRSERSTST
jgi:hypothetical protein